jgi:glycolate oxidase
VTDAPQAPPPTSAPSATRAALRALTAALGPSKVATGDARLPWSRDDSPYPSPLPDAVVHAASEDDVQTTIRLANEYSIPVVPRAGGTGRTGAALPLYGGIILATDSLSGIEEISKEDLTAVVRPGVVLADLHAACTEMGLFYPPDPSSLGTCMLGGNVATNAGGPRAFLYGSTRSWLLGVDVITGGGERLVLGGKTRKRSSGYELSQLFAGSEGTLGVATRITLKLLPKPPETLTVAVWCRSDPGAAAVAAAILAARFSPASLEFLDERTVDVVRGGLAVPEGGRALLIAEFDGEGVEVIAERLGNLLTGLPDVCVVHAAVDPARREALWGVRRALSLATRRVTRHKISEDVVVPRGSAGALLDDVARIGETHRVRHLTYGHAGDGNLHVNFLWNDDDEKPRIDAALDALFRATLARGGSLSGEHGIGIAKVPWFAAEHSATSRALQTAHKAAWDPKGILNPGKWVGGDRNHRDC